MDFYSVKSILNKHYKPKWTCWRQKTVKKHVKLHNRRGRRVYKLYLKTGRIEDFNRACRPMTNWDFD